VCLEILNGSPELNQTVEGSLVPAPTGALGVDYPSSSEEETVPMEITEGNSITCSLFSYWNFFFASDLSEALNSAFDHNQTENVQASQVSGVFLICRGSVSKVNPQLGPNEIVGLIEQYSGEDVEAGVTKSKQTGQFFCLYC